MKMMMALRLISTPTTPMANSAADSARASASIGQLLRSGLDRGSIGAPAQGDGADYRDQQQDAGELERQQVMREQRIGDHADGALLGEQPVHLAARKDPLGIHPRAAHHRDLGEQDYSE